MTANREGPYSKLMDDVTPCSEFTQDDRTREAPARRPYSVWPPAGPPRVAIMILTALCLVLLLCVISLASHHQGVSRNEGETGEGVSGRHEQEVNVTSLVAALHGLQQENQELLAKLAACAAPPAGSSNSSAPPPASSISAPLSPAASSTSAPLSPAASSTSAPPPAASSTSAPPPAASSTSAPPPAASSSSAAPPACPQDWLPFQGSCYLVSQQSDDWEAGQRFCETAGGHLAIVTTAEAQGFLWDLLPRGHWNAYWIGLSDARKEDDWTWVDGTTVVGGFWEEGEPNNHIDEDCGYIVKTRVRERLAVRSWYDAPCSMHWPFICQKVLGSQ